MWLSAHQVTENSGTEPSSQCQFDLAHLLEEEMKELGLTDIYLDDQCYLYGKLPATKGLEDKPAIGFIAHMDTVSDFCDHDITPVITENYSGEYFGSWNERSYLKYRNISTP